MPEQDWTLYDQAVFSTVAAEFELFITRQGGTGRGYDVTNMRGNGQIPERETFEIRKIIVMADEGVSEANALLWWQKGYIHILMNDTRVFEGTLKECVALSSFSGVLAQATAADFAAVNPEGKGRMLNNPLTIEGGTNFKVIVGQGTATDTADVDVKVLLEGMLTTPD